MATDLLTGIVSHVHSRDVFRVLPLSQEPRSRRRPQVLEFEIPEPDALREPVRVIVRWQCSHQLALTMMWFINAISSWMREQGRLLKNLESYKMASAVQQVRKCAQCVAESERTRAALRARTS